MSLRWDRPILMSKRHGNCPFGRPKRRLEGIFEVDIKEINL
jgi:hypothetical protein